LTNNGNGAIINLQYLPKTEVDDVKDLELIINYLNNTDEDFDETFEFLTKGMKSEDQSKLKRHFINRFSNFCSDKKIFQGGIVAVFGNGEFATELAYVLAESFKKETLLIDVDRLNPTVDFSLNIYHEDQKYSKNLEAKGVKGLSLIIDLINKNMLNTQLFSELLVKKNHTKYLSCIHGDHDIENFEYYTNSSLVKLMDISRERFNYTILSCNDFIYDAYTYLAIQKADRVLVPFQNNLLALHRVMKYMSFLIKQHELDQKKFYFIDFNTYQEVTLEVSDLKRITNSRYLGVVTRSQKRDEFRNLKRAYPLKMSKKNKYEYKHILTGLGIGRS